MQLLKDIAIFIAGLIIGGTINMLLVETGMMLFPAPSGFDMSTEEGLKMAMNHLSFEHFIFPFLSHAIGTLTGAMFVSRFAQRKQITAYGIGAAFLLGGISMIFMVGGPVWFIILDLTLAYIPMAWLGYRLGKG
jgi:hypothetical protein